MTGSPNFLFEAPTCAPSALGARDLALFLAHGIRGLRADSGERWARTELLGSLAYLTVLLAVLLLDRTPVLGA